MIADTFNITKEQEYNESSGDMLARLGIDDVYNDEIANASLPKGSTLAFNPFKCGDVVTYRDHDQKFTVDISDEKGITVLWFENDRLNGKDLGYFNPVDFTLYSTAVGNDWSNEQLISIARDFQTLDKFKPGDVVTYNNDVLGRVGQRYTVDKLFTNGDMKIAWFEGNDFYTGYFNPADFTLIPPTPPIVQDYNI